MTKIIATFLLAGLIVLCSLDVMAKGNTSEQALLSEQFKNLQKELIYLKDNQEIRNLINNLQNPVDDSDATGFRDNFANEGVFELIQHKNGKPHTIARLDTSQMKDFMNGRFEIFKKQGEQRRHLLTSIHIFEQSPKQAKAKITGLLLTTVKHKEIKLVTPLEYSVVVIKNKNGTWKFKNVTGYLDTSLDATD